MYILIFNFLPCAGLNMAFATSSLPFLTRIEDLILASNAAKMLYTLDLHSFLSCMLATDFTVCLCHLYWCLGQLYIFDCGLDCKLVILFKKFCPTVLILDGRQSVCSWEKIYLLKRYFLLSFLLLTPQHYCCSGFSFFHQTGFLTLCCLQGHL